MLIFAFLVCIFSAVIGYQRNFLVVVLTHDRPDGLGRLLESLSVADYTGCLEVDLKIRIDRKKDGSVDTRTRVLAEGYPWTKGKKEIEITPENEKIVGQWLNGTRTAPETHDMFIVIEDDIEVSPVYFQWLREAHEKYSSFARFAAVTLHRNHANISVDGSLENRHGVEIPHHRRAYFFIQPSSWAMSPHPVVWRSFLDWAHKTYVETKGISPTIAGLESTFYYNAHIKDGKVRSMWTMWWVYFCYTNKLYTLYPNYPNSGSLAINHRMAGVHFREKHNAPETFVNLPVYPHSWFPAAGKTPVVDQGGLISGLV